VAIGFEIEAQPLREMALVFHEEDSRHVTPYTKDTKDTEGFRTLRVHRLLPPCRAVTFARAAAAPR
jgi:hypothetical protein